MRWRAWPRIQAPLPPANRDGNRSGSARRQHFGIRGPDAATAASAKGSGRICAPRRRNSAAADSGMERHRIVQRAGMRVRAGTIARRLRGMTAAARMTAKNPRADTSMEFTLPPGELDRIFVESKARQRQPPLVPETGTPRSGSERRRNRRAGTPRVRGPRGARQLAAPSRAERLRSTGRSPPRNAFRHRSRPSSRSLMLAAALASGALRSSTWLCGGDLAAALLLARRRSFTKIANGCAAMRRSAASLRALYSAYGRSGRAAGESFRLSAAPVGRDRRSGRRRHLAGARQHLEHRGAVANPIRCCA